MSDKPGPLEAYHTVEELEKIQADARKQMKPWHQRAADEVQKNLDIENKAFDQSIDASNDVRKWAENLIGRKLTITQIEDLRDQALRAELNTVFLYSLCILKGGSNGIQSTYENIYLYKDAVGILHNARTYIGVLESTVIDLSKFTQLGFFGLIKLAFKRLFKRSK